MNHKVAPDEELLILFEELLEGALEEELLHELLEEERDALEKEVELLDVELLDVELLDDEEDTVNDFPYPLLYKESS